MVPVVRGFAPVPTSTLFSDFCRKKVVGKLPPALRAPLRDTVVRLEAAGGGGEAGKNAQAGGAWLAKQTSCCQGCHQVCELHTQVWCACHRTQSTAPAAWSSHTAPSLTAHPSPPHPCTGCRVHLASGQTLLCRAAVYTPVNRRPVLPAWVRPLLAPGTAAEAGSAAGRQQEGLIQQIQPQLPAGILTADTVHVGAAADLDGMQLVVVGGGMSAGLLAAGAAERGARVHLLCRRCACTNACRHFGGRAALWGRCLGTQLQRSCLHCAAGTDTCNTVAVRALVSP